MRPTLHPLPALKTLLPILLAIMPMTTLVQAQDQARDLQARDLSEDTAEAVSLPPRDEAPRRPAPPYYEAVVIESRPVLAPPDRGCLIEVDAHAGAGAGAAGPALKVSQRCAVVQSPDDPHHWSVVYTFRGRQYQAQLSSNPGPTLLVDRYGVPRG